MLANKLVSWLCVGVWLAGCGDDRCRPPFAVQVDVRFPPELRERGAVLYWADEAPDDEEPSTDSIVSLRRDLASREQAREFRGPFIGRVDGMDVALGEVDFSACDFVSELGYDPAKRVQAVFRYGLSSDGWLRPLTSVRDAAPLACLTTTESPALRFAALDPCIPPNRHLVYSRALPAPFSRTRVFRDGVEISLHG